MVYTGYQFEEGSKGFNVCYVEEGKIIGEKDLPHLNNVFSWIVEHRQNKKNLMNKIYEKNFRFINENNIKFGDIVQRRDKTLVIIKHIHPIYGWLSDDFYQINIDDIINVYNMREKNG